MHDRSAQGRQRDDGRQADLRRAEGADAPLFAECATSRLATVSEELARLVDDAHRRVEMARAGLQVSQQDPSALAALAQLREAASTLEAVGRVVHASMQAASAPHAEPPRSIAESLAHAVEVTSADARDRGVMLDVSVAQTLERLFAPAFYTIALHTLRWAVRTAREGDSLILRADAAPAPTGALWRFELSLPWRAPAPSQPATNTSDQERLALALAADLTRSAGGVFDLVRQHNAHTVRAAAPAAPAE
ncbi:MAG: hypothetical protein AB7G17_11035 [Phycisphaerales bacterium]